MLESVDGFVLPDIRLELPEPSKDISAEQLDVVSNALNRLRLQLGQAQRALLVR